MASLPGISSAVRRNLHRRHSGQTGFSLIELMVALVAGLIVVGAVVSFTVAVVQNNNQNVLATRLTQELRTVMDVVVRDLRRAGYNQTSIRGIGSGTRFVSPFATMQVIEDDTSGCIVYAYDRFGGNPGEIDSASGELRGVRRVEVNGRGAIEIHQGDVASAPDCDAALGNYATFPPACSASGWCPITDPRLFDVLRFAVADETDYLNPIASASTRQLLIRPIAISLQGRLVAAPDIVRGITSQVRVRTDCIRTDATNKCALPPGDPGDETAGGAP